MSLKSLIKVDNNEDCSRSSEVGLSIIWGPINRPPICGKCIAPRALNWAFMVCTWSSNKHKHSTCADKDAMIRQTH